MSCFCPESASTMENGGSGGERSISLNCRICAFVPARRTEDVRIHEYMRGCIPREFSRTLTVPSIIGSSSGPWPSDAAQPTHT